ncbi:MAG: sugar transferase, partial [Lachnospiraceae bacterium]
MYKRHIKRISDVMICIIALPFWFLLCVIIIPLIYFEDRGNPFYNALRLGKNGKLYKMYKFRS